MPPDPLSARLRHVWRWFGDLNETRRYVRTAEAQADQQGGAVWQTKVTADRIPYVEMTAWALATGVQLEAWHVAALSMIDEIYVAHYNDAGLAIRESSRKFSPMLFDALFEE